MDHAVVSGGAGFIGSHLCAALLERGAAVTCIDNLSTGHRRNVASLSGHSHFRLLVQDVTQIDARALDDGWLPQAPISRVYHLASPASVTDYLRMPLETMMANSEGTRRMLELARAAGARLLLASTSEIYGDPLIHPQPETYWGNVSSTGPRSPYDESKRFAEALAIQYWRTYGLDVRVVRIFNTYGPHSRLDDGRVVPNFVGQAIRHEPITIYGSGAQTRSLCYVSDLVAGLLAAMECEGLAGEVFNLGNPDEYTILEFAAVVQRLCGEGSGGAAPALDWRPLPVEDPTRRKPAIEKAREILGWEPRVRLEDGLRETIAWFRARMLAEEGESRSLAHAGSVLEAGSGWSEGDE